MESVPADARGGDYANGQPQLLASRACPPRPMPAAPEEQGGFAPVVFTQGVFGQVVFGQVVFG